MATKITPIELLIIMHHVPIKMAIQLGISHFQTDPHKTSSSQSGDTMVRSFIPVPTQ